MSIKNHLWDSFSENLGWGRGLPLKLCELREKIIHMVPINLSGLFIKSLLPSLGG